MDAITSSPSVSPADLRRRNSRYQQTYIAKPGNKEKHKAWTRAWLDTPAGKASLRKRSLKTKYGITVEEWDAMLIAQSGCCASCDVSMLGKLEPCVDHDHKTGKVRKLLCRRCNLALGLLQDSAHLISKLLQYVRS
jgi:hypothetical protein